MSTDKMNKRPGSFRFDLHEIYAHFRLRTMRFVNGLYPYLIENRDCFASLRFTQGRQLRRNCHCERSEAVLSKVMRLLQSPAMSTSRLLRNDSFISNPNFKKALVLVFLAFSQKKWGILAKYQREAFLALSTRMIKSEIRVYPCLSVSILE